MLASTEPAPTRPPLPMGTSGVACFAGADPSGARYYYRARYYDPKIGRFISEDPLGFDGGDNFFIYVENQPAMATDPMGLVATVNCQKKDAKAIERAAQKAAAKVKSGCLPCSEDKDKWIRKIQNATYHCDPNLGPTGPDPDTGKPRLIFGACAGAYGPGDAASGNDVTFFWPALSGNCGCLEDVLLHEIAHLVTGLPHSKENDKVDELALGCLSCTKQ